jgi:hypothetical protein
LGPNGRECHFSGEGASAPSADLREFVWSRSFVDTVYELIEETID